MGSSGEDCGDEVASVLDARSSLESLRGETGSLPSVLDDFKVPEDAGVYAAVLERMLRRIPDGWGRWISCSRGWYPLLAEAEEHLSRIDPEYQIHQVKEKFGELRIYVTAGDLSCCREWEASNPTPGPDEPPDGPLWQAWEEASQAHGRTPEHSEATAERSERCARLQRAAAEFEARSQRICEATGNPGVRMVSESGWYRTLDPVAAPDGFSGFHTADVEWRVRQAGDDPEALRSLVDSLVGERDHLSLVAGRLLAALREERSRSRSGEESDPS